MANIYDSHDHPCVNIENIIHITVSATKTLCGEDWVYSPIRERFKSTAAKTIKWTSPDKINCQKCIDGYNSENHLLKTDSSN